MDFEGWIGHLTSVLQANHPGVTPSMIDANAMYQAFANGVSPETFGSTPTLPLKTTPPPVAPSPVDKPLVQPPPAIPTVPSDTKPAWSDSTKPFTPKKSSLSGMHIALAVLGLLLVIVVVANLTTTGSNSGSNTNALATTEIPMTDEQKVEKAKIALSTWTGDESAYSESKGLLSTIPKGSKSSKDALALADKWEARKKEADKHKAEKAKADEALQKKRERQEALDAIKKEKEDMKYFTGDGDTNVAVPGVKLRNSTESHEARGNSTFVHVFVAVKNVGSDTIHANPNDFTLADSDGNTASPDTDTYGLTNYFNAVNLSPGQQTSGWLIFYLKKDKKYILTRNGGLSGSTVTKTIIP